jgi:hypothetical protein
MAYLTGDQDGACNYSRATVLDRADTLAAPFGIDANTLLTGRAALLGLHRRGPISAGGATRLLRTIDGWIALTLSRATDLESVPALLATDEPIDDPWAALQRAALSRSAAEFVDRAQVLEIPSASLGSTPPTPPTITRLWPRRDGRFIDPDLLVVDLSAMWAGPLCAMLLAHRGATVIKVESHDRPDGTRAGNGDFFRWMNGGKYQYQADFRGHTEPLRRLLDVADVVIEASRPRALRQSGLDAEHRAPRPGRVWVRITGYGPEFDNRVAFGDDAAVAGGLVASGTGGPVFVGDAVADPLTGIEAAHAVITSLERGGGEVIDVSMAAVAATYAALPLADPPTHSPAPQPPRPPEITTTQVSPDVSWIPGLIRDRLDQGC